MGDSQSKPIIILILNGCFGEINI